jgi:hypothetical protein
LEKIKDRIETDKYIDAGYSLLHKLNYDSAYTIAKQNSAETKKDTSRIISLINLADIHYIQSITLVLKLQQLKLYHYLKKERSSIILN